MHLRFLRILIITGLISVAGQIARTQDLTRELAVGTGGTVEIVNKFGRVGARAVENGSSLVASSATTVSDREVKITSANGRTVITVTAENKQKRIDLVLKIPERSNLKIETTAGAIEIEGNFASIEAKTDTGTIAVDVPPDDLKYQFEWTESRPRYLADFDIAEVEEKRAGRFEIKGRREERENGREGDREKGRQGDGDIEEAETRTGGSVPLSKVDPTTENKKPKAEDRKLKTVSLNFTTARGIILLNVPPNEVMSDLRERPLTNAAKAIVRSGDSLLMEAIRRAAPKYYGDYARTLPPLKFEPTFAERAARLDTLNAKTKTALVRVTDLNNRSIPGLGAKDFEVVENGQTREILSVEPSMAPFNLVLLLDVSGSVENYVNFIRKAARSFVNTVGKDDRVSLVIFNEDVKVLSKFTTDKGLLSTSLDSFDAGGGTAYYDALAYTIADTLRPLKGERTAIVILTDGDDNRSFLAFDSLTGSIQESGALIYPLYVPSGLIALAAQNLNADIDPTRRKYMSLSAKSKGEGDRLAKISGGVYYPITQIGQIQQAYEDIVIQMRSAYNVTFSSDNSAVGTNGASPRLKIRSNRENTFASVTSVVAAGKN